jgi:pyrroloquinoline quinone biosynthesis protein D
VIPTGRLSLTRGARLRPDRETGGYLLVYPERALALNPTAGAIVKRIDGSRTLAAIVASLAEAFPNAPTSVLEEDVTLVLEALAARGLVIGDAS